MPNFLLENENTERLFFRRVSPADFNDWLPFFYNPLSTKYWDGISLNPADACKDQFDKIFERYEMNLGGMNALILKQTGQLVGLCGLLVQHVDSVEVLEIGYSVLPKFWRKGFAFEAAHKCKDFAFQNKLADSLISIIHVDNIPSQKVAIKIGMYLEKTTTYKDNPVHIFRVDHG
ncbi:Ribosomal-protein-alanine N-acetyltransferase [Flagellimonas maritima]|uniref:Ribosomal-protein-alanine N-acetyltransferase n=1 Tax=Flagellimonas maritima TaxID=1383885 RepID=A0A2Z4LP26_9FLAO|nr:GNAT family N-acetyltransferase [Allomuricauda aurantiaca]AWX43566.1 Ribosomal-protein-alanine N-acetyltransferase [Allomuricauda aurantiaca]